MKISEQMLCEEHGHSLMPVLGFDNEISDYQCMICGIFESKIMKDKKANFYCQKECGEVEFSINEWNETQKSLELTTLSEKEKQDILFPTSCENQCFSCLAIVGERQLKTKRLTK